jgi:hypothetical protein
VVLVVRFDSDAFWLGQPTAMPLLRCCTWTRPLGIGFSVSRRKPRFKAAVRPSYSASASSASFASSITRRLKLRSLKIGPQHRLQFFRHSPLPSPDAIPSVRFASSRRFGVAFGNPRVIFERQCRIKEIAVVGFQQVMLPETAGDGVLDDMLTTSEAPTLNLDLGFVLP